MRGRFLRKPSGIGKRWLRAFGCELMTAVSCSLAKTAEKPLPRAWTAGEYRERTHFLRLPGVSWPAESAELIGATTEKPGRSFIFGERRRRAGRIICTLTGWAAIMGLSGLANKVGVGFSAWPELMQKIIP